MLSYQMFSSFDCKFTFDFMLNNHLYLGSTLVRSYRYPLIANLFSTLITFHEMEHGYCDCNMDSLHEVTDL